MIEAEGSGEIGYNYENMGAPIPVTALAVAVPAEGEEFIGWYSEAGELLSTELEYDFSGIIGSEDVLIARFTGGEAPVLPGDVDGNGEVAVSDAVLALRAAMGILELTPEQFEAADMSGDGEIAVSDAILILRTAMGLR